jgi:HPt (histidine-containing phosphotransfer) domain-containing protein
MTGIDAPQFCRFAGSMPKHVFLNLVERHAAAVPGHLHMIKQYSLAGRLGGLSHHARQLLPFADTFQAARLAKLCSDLEMTCDIHPVPPAAVQQLVQEIENAAREAWLDIERQLRVMRFARPEPGFELQEASAPLRAPRRQGPRHAEVELAPPEVREA